MVRGARREYIKIHKRLNTFDVTDYDLLCGEIVKFSGLLLSPNVLTETSNLARQINDPAKSEIAAVLAAIIGQSDEQFLSSRVAVSRKEYIRLGLTDAVLLALCGRRTVLLTVDLELHLAAQRLRLKSINFNTIRDQRRDFR